MLKLKTKWISMAALSAALLAGTAWSQGLSLDGPDPAQGRRARGGPVGMSFFAGPGLQEQLGLTEEQIEQLRAMRLDAAKSGIRTRAELRIKRLELRELLQAEEPDRALIEKKVRELSDAQYTAHMQRIDQRLAFRSVLSPEQRAKMRSLRRQRLLRRRHRGPRGFGRGQRRFGPPRGRPGPGMVQPPAEPPAK